MRKRPTRSDAEQEFTTIFHDHADAIFRHCAFKLFDRSLAHDITQETFLRAWQQIERGTQIDNMRAFLYRVAGNLIIDHIRKKKSVSLDALQEQGFDPGYEDISMAENRLEMGRAMAAMEKMEEEYRSVIHLRYIEGYSVSEIAAMTGDLPNTISVRLHRGLQQLRSHLRHG